MGEAKPTTEKPWAYVPEGQMIVMGSDITRMIADVRGWGWLQKLPNGADKQDANGRLIADAGTVHHQTGLTPSQLVERVKELEAIVSALVAYDESDHSDGVLMMLSYADMLKAARAALSKARPNTAEGASHDKALDEALRERDEADDFIDALLDEVLGADRAEWSSAYGRADALEEVRERITALHKPAVDRAWAQFETATQQVGASVTVSVGSQEFDLAETGAHFTTEDMATACGQAFREGQASPAAQAALAAAKKPSP